MFDNLRDQSDKSGQAGPMPEQQNLLQVSGGSTGSLKGQDHLTTAQSDTARQGNELIFTGDIYQKNKSTPEKQAEAILTGPDQAQRDRLSQDAAAILKDMHSFWGLSNKSAINQILLSRTEAERVVIDRYYTQQNNGVSLIEQMKRSTNASESDLYALELAMAHKDNNDADTNASRIIQGLLQEQKPSIVRTGEQLSKDIRITLATHNAEQIAEIQKEFQDKTGHSMTEVIQKDPYLSPEFKQEVAILMKGNDKTTDQDMNSLIKSAITHQNLDLFDETMARASDAVRQNFRDRGTGNVDAHGKPVNGDDELVKAFDHDFIGHHSLAAARDYANEGRLDTATKISWNSGLGHGIMANSRLITQAIAQMSDREKTNYTVGRQLALGQQVSGLDARSKQEALDTYNRIHTAIAGTGRSAQQAKYENLITNKSSSLSAPETVHSSIKPEDQIRNYMVGFGGSSDIVSTLKGIKPTEVRAVEQAYQDKYHRSLRGDLTSKLSSHDKIEAERILSSNQSADAQLAETARLEEEANSSIFVSPWKAHLADDALNNLSFGLGRANSRHQSVDMPTFKQARDQVNITVDAANDSKTAPINAVVTGVTFGVAVGMTGGLGLLAIPVAAAVDAASVVATKKIVLGDAYDPNTTELLTDAAQGAVMGGTSVLAGAGALTASTAKTTFTQGLIRSTVIGGEAGVAGGVVQAGGNLDSHKSAAENFKQASKTIAAGAVSGAAGGAVFHTGASAINLAGTPLLRKLDNARGAR